MWGAPVFAASLLSAAIVDDLRFAKVRNIFILTFAAVGLALQFYQFQFDGFVTAAFGFSAGFGLSLPLYLARALGGGDVKLLAVLGLGTSWQVVTSTAVYSLFWGALLGLFLALLRGELQHLLLSTLRLLKPASASLVAEKKHKLPYTVALMFGWLTYFSLSGGFSQ